MSHSKSVTLPKKPHPDFPLFPHATGRWAKKVRGKLHYFGKTETDPKGEAALLRWLEEKDDLLAGRTPRPKGNTIGVADLVNHFLTHKKNLLDSGELAPRTWSRYDKTCGMLVDFFGRNRPVDDLAADDFQSLRVSMAKRWGPIALGNEIQIVRSIFRYGHDVGLLDKAIRFGPTFKKPSAKVLRQARSAGGPKMFSAEQICALLAVASPNMKAMVLLGINGGLGNTDMGMLPITALDLKSGWLDYPRPKTGMDRRIPLWAETVEAIRRALEKRHEPKEPADVALLFIGRRGESYAGEHKGYRVAQEFKRTLHKAGFNSRTFYDLRRTFQTIAEGAHDLVAVQSIMGHAPSSGDMSSIYRQFIDDARLRAVADHVHNWLNPPTPAKPIAEAKKRKATKSTRKRAVTGRTHVG